MKIKEKIKEMSELQTKYKQHRKTVNFKGERMKFKNWRGETVELMPSSAAYKVMETKEDLRHHFIAYTVLRSRISLEEFKQNNILDRIEAKRREEPSWSQVEKIVNLYKTDFVNLEEAA